MQMNTRLNLKVSTVKITFMHERRNTTGNDMAILIKCWFLLNAKAVQTNIEITRNMGQSPT